MLCFDSQVRKDIVSVAYFLCLKRISRQTASTSGRHGKNGPISSLIKLTPPPFCTTARRTGLARSTGFRRTHKLHPLLLSHHLFISPLIDLPKILRTTRLRPDSRHLHPISKRTGITVLLTNARKLHQLRQQTRIPQRIRLLQPSIEVHALLLELEKALEFLGC